MHEVVVLALPGTIAFDLATPVEVFSRVRDGEGRAAYRTRVAGPEPVVDAGVVRLVVEHPLALLDEADTIVLPGRGDPTCPVPTEVLERLRGAAARGTRLASICVGAFTLAATGLLDGRRATTHWAAADLFRAHHPRVQLDPGVLYVDHGSVLTSAGATAGVDLCLHLVENDHGAATAAEAARYAVSPLHREGGQAQFVPRRIEGSEAVSLDPLLTWLTAHSDHELTLRDIAARAGFSERTLNRRFRAETGRAPLQWLSHVRIRQAQELLEVTDSEVERIARRVGFPTPSSFRAAFVRQVGVAPLAYRRTFRRSTVDA
jgi:transcriptional regulator GlxA family with amidase domain